MAAWSVWWRWWFFLLRLFSYTRSWNEKCRSHNDRAKSVIFRALLALKRCCHRHSTRCRPVFLSLHPSAFQIWKTNLKSLAPAKAFISYRQKLAPAGASRPTAQKPTSSQTNIYFRMPCLWFAICCIRVEHERRQPFMTLMLPSSFTAGLGELGC